MFNVNNYLFLSLLIYTHTFFFHKLTRPFGISISLNFFVRIEFENYISTFQGTGMRERKTFPNQMCGQKAWECSQVDYTGACQCSRLCIQGDASVLGSVYRVLGSVYRGHASVLGSHPIVPHASALLGILLAIFVKERTFGQRGGECCSVWCNLTFRVWCNPGAKYMLFQHTMILWPFLSSIKKLLNFEKKFVNFSY